MYFKYRTIIHQFGLLFFLVSGLALAGCGGGSTETAPPPADKVTISETSNDETVPQPESPVAVEATPDVRVITDPIDIEEVETGTEVAISLEVSGGPNLQFAWKVTKGTLSSTDGASAIYTAPAEPGQDIVDITITSDNGSTTKAVHFRVVEPTDTTQPEEEESAPSMPLTLTGIEDGQKVPCENNLEGTYLEDEITGKIWPVVIVNGRWHPQDNNLEPALKAGGKWYGIALFGECDDPTNSQGVTFQLFIIDADDTCHDAFDTYLRTAANNKEWPGLSTSDVPQSCLDNAHVKISVVRE